MNIQKQFNDDKSAVSPVIGVILMVAITVILAAVIASFVLGMGPDTATTPTATFSSEVDETSDTLTITMESGNSINPDNVEFSYETANGGEFDNSTVHTNSEDTDDTEESNIQGESWSASQRTSDDITAGSSATIDFDSFSSGSKEDYTVRLIYVEGDTTSTLQTFEGSY